MTAQLPQLMSEAKTTRDDAKRTLRSWWRFAWRGIVAEFLATLMLVFFGCMGSIPLEGVNMVINPPFVVGFVVMFNTQIFGHISGAYMNPAITLASVIIGRTPISVGISYAIAEVAGALAGYGILLTLSPLDMVEGRICVSMPHADLHILQALSVETALTAALIFLNCGLWDPVNASKQDSAAIKFGLTTAALSLAGGQISGASMNPGRSLAPAIWTGYWSNYWIYCVGPFMGSLVAVAFYKFAFLKKREID